MVQGKRDKKQVKSDSDSPANRGDLSPSHWQGEPLPHGHEEQTQDIGFDQRHAGRAKQRQYGRAGDKAQADKVPERSSKPETPEQDTSSDGGEGQTTPER